MLKVAHAVHNAHSDADAQRGRLIAPENLHGNTDVCLRQVRDQRCRMLCRDVLAGAIWKRDQPLRM